MYLVSKLELTARNLASGLDEAKGKDKIAEWHRPGMPGGKLRNERSKKTDPAVDNPVVAVSKLKSRGNKRVEVSNVDERLELVRRPCRSCMAILKDWTLESFEGTPRWKQQGDASRKLGEQALRNGKKVWRVRSASRG